MSSSSNKMSYSSYQGKGDKFNVNSEIASARCLKSLKLYKFSKDYSTNSQLGGVCFKSNH